jgi:cytochrome d ubiquinol oxidase subunit II
VVLDGLDLGVGILFGSTQDEGHRSQMMSTIAPFWDGNETWLVVIGAGLFASFPVVYAVFMGAFYLPLLLLLVGLIFRGIAFEFRYRSVRARKLWDAGFFLGSTVVAFAQGAAVGALMRGIPVANEQFAGTSFDWLHPFSVLTGIGLVFGYALLGAGWIVLKSEGALRDWAYRRIGWLASIVFVLLGLAFTVSLTVDAGAVAQSHLRDRAWGLVFPVAAIAALGSAVMSARARRDGLTFALTVLFVLASYLTLGVMFWPYMVPYSITVGKAAAPEASLSFMFYGGVVVLPVIAIYTAGVYWVFRGKIQQESE